MKVLIILFVGLLGQAALAESLCDIRVGSSLGIKVVEFASGNIVHSKIPVKEISAKAIEDEMISLQDLEVCSEKIQAKKCVLKLEKAKKSTIMTLIRGTDRWFSWSLKGKQQAQEFIKKLQAIGFCS